MITAWNLKNVVFSVLAVYVYQHALFITLAQEAAHLSYPVTGSIVSDWSPGSIPLSALWPNLKG